MTDGNPDRYENQLRSEAPTAPGRKYICGQCAEEGYGDHKCPSPSSYKCDVCGKQGAMALLQHVNCGGCPSLVLAPSTTTSDPAFKKDDAGKNLLGCLPPHALLAIGRVLTFGAAKYSRDNWHRNRSLARYYDALLRHLFAWWAGEDKDPETGESHLAHAGCCLMFLLELIEVGAASGTQAHEDDRPVLGRVAPGPRGDRGEQP